MIGGTVIEVIQLPDKVWINCEENNSSSQCAIYVERNAKSLCVERSDQIWWQGGWAMWTPYSYKQGTGKDGKDFDIKLPRIGFSGVVKPQAFLKHES